MSQIENRCLDAFPNWLRSLGDDCSALGTLLQSDVPEPARRQIAGSLNYLFKSLDLIPDGIEDLGFIDDAFVFRVSSALAVKAGASTELEPLGRLAGDADLVREFLGDDYARLEKFTAALERGIVRGRSVDDIVGDDAVRAALVSDVKGWASSYEAPSFARDAKNLVKLKSFLSTKLPQA